MKYDSREVKAQSKGFSNIDLTASVNESTGAYYCTELDSIFNSFIQTHLKASQAKVISLRGKQIEFGHSFNREPVLQRILADLNKISNNQFEDESISSALLSWEELKYWCHLQKENLLK